QALDVLSDLLKPVLRQEDFEMEKQVIINEIGRYEDMPGWAAYDQSQKVYFEGHKLGNSILGTPNTIAALTREQMTAYLNQRYTGPNITLSVAGCFDWPALLNEVRSRCTTWAAHKPSRLNLAETNGSGKFSLLRREKVSQEYVIMISPGPAASSTLRHAADLLGMAIGDDSGSRFYWELVDPGLAESASCYFREYQDTGAFYTSFSCDREQAQENLGIVQGILEDIGRSSISQEELDQARSKLLSRVVRSGERPKGRMFSMGSSWTCYEKYRSIDDELQDYEKVTLKDIQAVLTRFPMLQLTTVALGPLENLEMPWKK
ncbi:MAG: M16 family metallopeptidase, partial [Gemmataceae bacterium]